MAGFNQSFNQPYDAQPGINWGKIGMYAAGAALGYGVLRKAGGAAKNGLRRANSAIAKEAKGIRRADKLKSVRRATNPVAAQQRRASQARRTTDQFASVKKAQREGMARLQRPDAPMVRPGRLSTRAPAPTSAPAQQSNIDLSTHPALDQFRGGSRSPHRRFNATDVFSFV